MQTKLTYFQRLAIMRSINSLYEQYIYEEKHNSTALTNTSLLEYKLMFHEFYYDLVKRAPEDAKDVAICYVKDNPALSKVFYDVILAVNEESNTADRANNSASYETTKHRSNDAFILNMANISNID
jgi:hypothetical protein